MRRGPKKENREQQLLAILESILYKKLLYLCLCERMCDRRPLCKPTAQR